jgi:sugar phosphate permease
MIDTTTLTDRTGPSSDAAVIGLISAAHFASHFFILLLPPLFAPIRSDYGVSYAELGLALAAFNVVSALLQTPAGFLVDRLGAATLLIGGLILGATAIVLASLSTSFWVFVAMFGVLGLANTVYHPADYSILSQAVGTRRVGQAFSIHSFSGLLGSAAAPATMLLFAGIWGWRGALMGAALIGYAIAAVLLLNRRGLEPGERRAAKPAGQEAIKAGTRDTVDDKARTGWHLLLSAPILRNLVFFVLLALSGGGLQNFSVVALGALYETPAAVANMALSGFLLMSALGVLLGGFVADRTAHHNRVAAAGFAASAVIVLMIGTVDLGTVLLVLAMSLGGLLNGIIVPSRDMIVRAVTPPGSFGKVFGFVSTGFNIGGIVSPLLFGWLMDRGDARIIFLLVAGFVLTSLLIVLAGWSDGHATAKAARPSHAR